MNEFQTESRLISFLVNNLMDESNLRSWNVVMPPCFGGERIAQQLFRMLRSHQAKPYVSLISADGLKNPEDFVRELHFGWNKVAPISLPMSSKSPQILLAQLLDNTGDLRKKIQIVVEFHKILSCLDDRILVALRDAEQAGRIQTVTISIYQHKWIRDKWRQEGTLLHVSNYGDTHGFVEPEIPTLEELNNQFGQGVVPSGILSQMYSWSGGYPDLVKRGIETWISLDKPDFVPNVQWRIRDDLKRLLIRLVRNLDLAGDSRFRKLVVETYVQFNHEESAERLRRFHPWGKILTSGGELRSELLGEAAVDYEVDALISCENSSTDASSITSKAIDFYKSGHYLSAVRLLNSIKDVAAKSPVISVLLANASIMAVLFGDGTERPGTDTDWRNIKKLLVIAREQCSRIDDNRLKVTLEKRYDAINQLVESILPLLNNKRYRLVDYLAGITGNEEHAVPAYAMLTLQIEAARRIRGNSAACKMVLEIPEQAFRVWAWWKYKLDYYAVPSDSNAIWELVKRDWPSHFSNLRIPSGGESFGSIQVFARFIYAHCISSGSSVPWKDVNDLDSCLSFFQKRNASAHAVTIFNYDDRTAFFDAIDYWMNRIENECGDRKLSRQSVNEMLSPFPVPKLSTVI